MSCFQNLNKKTTGHFCWIPACTCNKYLFIEVDKPIHSLKNNLNTSELVRKLMTAMVNRYITMKSTFN